MHRRRSSTKYIRYIYNCVVLENAIVRAAAVTALAKFGAEVDKDSSIRANIKVLLTRCLDDLDDEVRDRAAVNLKFLEDEDISAKFIRNSISTSDLNKTKISFHVFSPSFGT